MDFRTEVAEAIPAIVFAGYTRVPVYTVYSLSKIVYHRVCVSLRTVNHRSAIVPRTTRERISVPAIARVNSSRIPGDVKERSTFPRSIVAEQLTVPLQS